MRAYNENFSPLRQTAKHEKVIEKLQLLLSITNVLVMNKETIIQALNSKFKDFEDALQNYAAENADDIKVIITRNVKDFKNSNLGVITPINYLKLRNASL